MRPLAPRALAPILGVRAADVVAGAPDTLSLADLDAETSAGFSDDLLNQLSRAIEQRTRTEWWRLASMRPFAQMPEDFSFDEIELSIRARNALGRFPRVWLREATIDHLMATPGLGSSVLVELLWVYERVVDQSLVVPRSDIAHAQSSESAVSAFCPLAPRPLAPILAKPSSRYARNAPPGDLADLGLAESRALSHPVARKLNDAIVRLVANRWQEVAHELAFPSAPAGFSPLSLAVGLRAHNCLGRGLPASGATATVGQLMGISNLGATSLLEILRGYEIWGETAASKKALAIAAGARETLSPSAPPHSPNLSVAERLPPPAEAGAGRRPMDDRTKAMYRTYEAGATLAEIGERYGVSRERVRQLFRDAGLPTRSIGEAAALKHRRLFGANREAIVNGFESGKTAEIIAAEQALPLNLVREVLAEDPRRARMMNVRSRRKRNGPRYSDDELIDCLRSASLAIGGVLTTAAYSSLAKASAFPDGRTWPTHQTPSNRFGSWRAALERAGLESNPPSAIAGQRIFTRGHCIDAVLEVERDVGRLPTASDYEEFAAKMGGALPSIATVRNRCGSWGEALRLAVEFS